MPELQAFYDKYQNKQVGLIMVNIMQGETLEGIKDFMRQNNYSMPIAIDSQGKAGSLYAVRGIPQTYFIDAQGMIRYSYPSPITLKTIEQFLKKIK